MHKPKQNAHGNINKATKTPNKIERRPKDCSAAGCCTQCLAQLLAEAVDMCHIAFIAFKIHF